LKSLSKKEMKYFAVLNNLKRALKFFNKNVKKEYSNILEKIINSLKKLINSFK
jgi:hypothetical protein